MQCVACGSAAVSERPERTAQGYGRFRCRACGKQFNERSAGVLNRAQYPSDVVALVVLWRLRYKLSLRDLAEMFLIRGIVFSHEAVRDWETKLTPALAEFAASAAPRQGREELVRRRDLRQNQKPLVLPLSCHRYVGRAGGREAERNTRHGSCQGVLPFCQDGHRHHASPGHDGRTRQLPKSDPDRTR